MIRALADQNLSFTRMSARNHVTDRRGIVAILREHCPLRMRDLVRELLSQFN